MIVGLEDITPANMLIGDRRVKPGGAAQTANLSMVFQNTRSTRTCPCSRTRLSRLRCGACGGAGAGRGIRCGGRARAQRHLDRKPANLFGGAAASGSPWGRAIVREADAFLFDEPLSNLDAKLRGQMRTEICPHAAPLGTTTVYVTHDQTEAMTLGDRVAVLRRGVLQQVATPRELYEQPVNLFVPASSARPHELPAWHSGGGTITLPVVTFDLPPEMRDAVGDGRWSTSRSGRSASRTPAWPTSPSGPAA
jgi:multiple sugar transport system ATP-binding protein